MKLNKWTLGLAAVGVVSLASAARADEKMNQVQTLVSGTTLSGSVDVAAVWRPGTDNNAASSYYQSYYGSYYGYYGYGNRIPMYSFAKNDGFYLNAIDIALDKPLDESPWAAGYHVELMAGPDAVPGNAFTATYDGDSYLVTQSGAPVSIRQAYIALRTPVGNSAIDWKVGVWDSPLGYESSSDALNPNYTRSYGYSSEPTTFTGILGTFKVNDMITLQAGVADNGNGINNMRVSYESQKAYMGTFALTAPDSFGWAKGATFNLGIIHSVASSYWGDNTKDWLYAGATVPTPLTALKVGATFDYMVDHDGYNYGPNNRNLDDSSWIVGLYANYQINDKASFNLRGEYVHDDGEGPYAYNTYSTYYGSLRVANAAEVTATLQYNLWANVLSRVEFRWDHVEHGNAFGVNSYNGEGYYYDYGYPNKANDFMLALNLIYQF